MSQRSLRVSSIAAAQIAEAADFIAAQSSATAALQWLEGLDSFLQSLIDMPERFPVAPEDEHFCAGVLRRALYHQHRVLFTVDNNVVDVLHVRHGKRDELTDI